MIWLAMVAILVALILVLRVTAPKRYAVHASTVKHLPDGIPSEGPWMPVIVRDGKNGGFFDVDDRFVGHGVGESMAGYGIPSGATFIGDYLDSKTRLSLKEGDVVVIDEQTNEFDTSLALRRVKNIKKDKVTFLPDSLNTKHSPADLDRVFVKVSHVIRASDETDPIVSWMRQHFLGGKKNASHLGHA